MQYPTTDEINSASREQLGRWIRFLPSPGMSSVGELEFSEVMELQADLLSLIIDRFNALGGWNADLSKTIGWGKNHNGF